MLPPRSVTGAIAVEGIPGGEGVVDDWSGVRHLVHVVDGAAGRTEARHQRVRSLDDLDLLEASHVHGTAGHGRRPDRDAVVERGDLVAGKATHREDGGRAGRIAAGDADCSLGDVGRGPDAQFLHRPLTDDLDGRRHLARDDAEPGADVGDGCRVERRLHRAARSLRGRNGDCRGATIASRGAPGRALLLSAGADGRSLSRRRRRHDHRADLPGAVVLRRALRERRGRQRHRREQSNQESTR
ncbi:hypothetical protein AB7M70_003119 [Bradyrhizobium japonicum]